ncbi:MAG: outer-membrane lipoprotein carrier protein LolA [Spirochaetota bacterium]
MHALRYIILSAVLSALLFPQPKIAESSEVVNLLVANQQHLSSFRGRFIERNGTTVTKGEVCYKRPNKFMLEYKSPKSVVTGDNGKNQAVVCNGTKLWIYLPRIHVVSEQDVKTEVAGLYTGKGVLRLKEDYYFNFFGKREMEELRAFRATDLTGSEKKTDAVDEYLEQDARQAYHMFLTPKPHLKTTDKAGFTSIHVWIDKSGMILRSLGVSTTRKAVEYVFSDIERNVDINDATFDFLIPDNVQVVRNNLVAPKKKKEDKDKDEEK